MTVWKILVFRGRKSFEDVETISGKTDCNQAFETCQRHCQLLGYWKGKTSRLRVPHWQRKLYVSVFPIFSFEVELWGEIVLVLVVKKGFQTGKVRGEVLREPVFAAEYPGARQLLADACWPEGFPAAWLKDSSSREAARLSRTLA